MTVDVYIANGYGTTPPEQNDFKMLYSRIIEKERKSLTQDGIEDVVWSVLDDLITPLVKAAGLGIPQRQFYWRTASDMHEVGYKRFDFGREDKLWLMVVLR